MLMDSTTLASNRELCGTEPSSLAQPPAHLTASEHDAFNALTPADGEALRLEQERIPYSQLENFLRSMASSRPHF